MQTDDPGPPGPTDLDDELLGDDLGLGADTAGDPDPSPGGDGVDVAADDVVDVAADDGVDAPGGDGVDAKGGNGVDFAAADVVDVAADDGVDAPGGGGVDAPGLDGVDAPGGSTESPKATKADQSFRPADDATGPGERAPAPDPRPPAFADDALALRFTEAYRDELRYVFDWGKWLQWDGCRWGFDHTLKAFDLARAVCRTASSECKAPKVRTAIASAKTVAAVEKLAKADRAHAATADQWDVDPWLLNTPDGVVDLTTGDLKPHRRPDYMTKITAVSPGGECPRWLAFLDRVTAGDEELQAFLQRVAGYALTGITREHALFFFYGTGGNGKGVFLNTISGILNDYATTAPMDTFLATRGERHPTDIAGLRAARLVTAIETEEGRRWAEAKIKALTGGDPISARFMRQDFFVFTPQFKLIVAGNHKPGLRAVDEAMRRRLHLVPFTVTIPPHERDDTLGEKLKAEWPGILTWAIGGCLDWQRIGLAPPEAVRAATEEYLESEDALSRWLEECCTTEPNDYATTATLYVSWKAWADRAGEFAGSRRRFSQALRDRGHIPQRQSGTGQRGFRGLAVVLEAPAGQWWDGPKEAP